MRIKDINQAFTSKMYEYITKGYIVNPESMSIYEPGICKVDLSNDNTLLRIWVEKGFNSYTGQTTIQDWVGPYVVLRVGVWKYPLNHNVNDTSTGCVSCVDMEIIEEIVYYQFNRLNKEPWYINDPSLITTIRLKKRLRSHSKPKAAGYLVEDITDKARDIGYNYLKRKVGYKRVNIDKIRVTKDTSYYKNHKHFVFYVHYNGTRYVLS